MSPPRWITLPERAPHPRRLDLALLDALARMTPPLTPSRRQVQALIEGGALRLDGQAQRRPSLRVEAHARLELLDSTLESLRGSTESGSTESGRTAQAKAARAQPSPEPSHTLTPDHILYEDEAILALEKPAGLPSHQTLDPGRDHVIAALTRLLRARGEDSPYLALHHRLDVDTTGVMVVARAKRANAALARAFAQRHARKTYLAAVQWLRPQDALTTPWPWIIQDHLAYDEQAERMTRVLARGDWAKTTCALLGLAPGTGVGLVAARPHTGRRHQIRAHLSLEGAPLLGDLRYGGPARDARGLPYGRVMLHAHQLTLEHPLSGQRLTLTSPAPADLVAACGLGLERMQIDAKLRLAGLDELD